ncbi:MAG TPA: hypothetical protein PKC76_11280 [Saprospiraceae bacterium]|nr:hypothetical protein [Saprospiraceae bacterium]HMP24708.1 hypothetical protein [Saprospiraceae bacterium]
MAKKRKIPPQLLRGSKTRKHLAREYEMSDSTFYRRLRALQLRLPRRLLVPEEYIVIYEHLGPPEITPPNTPQPPPEDAGP